MLNFANEVVERIVVESARPDWTLLAISELISVAIVLVFRSMFSI
jgi:hypothetical protein